MSRQSRAEHSRARRRAWLLLLIAWLPVWTLFSALIVVAHPQVALNSAILIALRLVTSAAALGYLVQLFVDRFPWPRPIHLRFLALQSVAAVVYSAAWVLLTIIAESLMRGRLVLSPGPGLGPYLVTGVWLYATIGGVLYANQTSERAARAEAESQLAALRAQLNPHFLFNALHGIIQLISLDAKRAAHAAELLAGLLRTTIEENRDLIELSEEWAFVERYLTLERMRFGERLRVSSSISDEARAALVPTFAVQTMVENAVRHGAAPRVEPTDLGFAAHVADGVLTLQVVDNGAGATDSEVFARPGSGLVRVRERLAVLYGKDASLEVATTPGRGFTATIELPADAA